MTLAETYAAGHVPAEPILSWAKRYAQERGLSLGEVLRGIGVGDTVMGYTTMTFNLADRIICFVEPPRGWHEPDLIRHYESVNLACRRRPRTKCARGHTYTPENTYTHNGRRFCRQCRAERGNG